MINIEKLLEDFLADLNAATNEEILAEWEKAREDSKDAMAEQVDVNKTRMLLPLCENA